MSASSGLLDPRRKGSITGRALVLAVVLIILAVTLAVPIRSWFAQRAQIAGLEADVASAQAQVDSLTLQKERWADPAFVAAEARRRLHFVLPGEIGYVTLGADGQPLDGSGLGTTPAPSWYASLYGALQQADRLTGAE
jgi:cell division protein FtsB